MTQPSRISDGQNSLEVAHLQTGVSALRQATVLVVEEIEALRHHMINILCSSVQSAFDIAAIGFANSASASEALAYSPDMIVLDLSGNFANGIKLAEAVWHEQPKVKFLFWCISAKQISVRRLESLLPAQAVYGCIMKSATDDQLTFAIQSLLVHSNCFVEPKMRETDYKQRQHFDQLSTTELKTLKDIAIGLTDCAIAERNNISARGVQSRASSLFTKVLSDHKYDPDREREKDRFNPRTRLIFEALSKGLIDVETLEDWSKDYAGDPGCSSDFSP